MGARLLRLAVLVTAVSLAPAAAADTSDVASLASRFVSALVGGDGAAACAAMTADLREAFAAAADSTCADAVRRERTAATVGVERTARSTGHGYATVVVTPERGDPREVLVSLEARSGELLVAGITLPAFGLRTPAPRSATTADVRAAGARALAWARAAYVDNDGAAACGLTGSRLRTAMARAGRPCAARFSEQPDWFPQRPLTGDDLVQDHLSLAFTLALELRPRQGAPFFAAGGVGELVRRLNANDPRLRFVVGASARAARNLPPSTIVIDRALTDAAHLVLYGESDTGTIWRLRGTARGHTELAAAGRGVRGPEPKPWDPGVRAQLVDAAAAGDGTVFATVRVVRPRMSPLVFQLLLAPQIETVWGS